MNKKFFSLISIFEHDPILAHMLLKFQKVLKVPRKFCFANIVQHNMGKKRRIFMLILNSL
jgi:hypothetical protein